VDHASGSGGSGSGASGSGASGSGGSGSGLGSDAATGERSRSTLVAAAVLAAGRGSRLRGPAEPKPLVRVGDRSLAERALAAPLAAGLAPVLLVVGWRGDEVATSAPPGVRIVESPRHAEGIAHSVHAALDALEPDELVAAVCVGLADQPLVGAEAYRRLAAAHAAGATFAVATYGGRRANPVLIARELWPAVRSLGGDVGARALMAEHDVTEVDCTDTGDPRDVDTLDDLHALARELDGAPEKETDR
jgi:molybdenum cofactor cytidylyltransferase